MHHRDPFDCMLIAQSIEENMPLVTADPTMERYPDRTDMLVLFWIFRIP
jgi:PIN domain nuclease of toxin-antitoxin system